MGMFNQLDTKFHNCWFDSLCLSAKFAKAAYCHPKMIRIGRDLPKCVIQEEKKDKNDIRAVRGMVITAVFVRQDSKP